MKIHLATHYGLCFGVRDAITLAENLADEAPLTVLGELVHNPVVRDRLSALGVREAPLKDTGSARTQRVLITAHGASDTAREAWKHAGFAVADATCPLVRHAHTQLRTLVQMGCHPVVIGKAGHVEVLGLTGDFPDASVIETPSDLDALPPAARYGVVSQTTQPLEKVRGLVAVLQARYPQSEVIFRDTVCQPTKDRQRALNTLLATCDTMVVVGGQNSNNTLALAAAARAAGVRTIHVTAPGELLADQFSGAENVGVTAGTSTLKETVAAVVARLHEFAASPRFPSAACSD